MHAIHGTLKAIILELTSTWPDAYFVGGDFWVVIVFERPTCTNGSTSVWKLEVVTSTVSIGESFVSAIICGPLAGEFKDVLSINLMEDFESHVISSSILSVPLDARVWSSTINVTVFKMYFGRKASITSLCTTRWNTEKYQSSPINVFWILVISLVGHIDIRITLNIEINWMNHQQG